MSYTSIQMSQISLTDSFYADIPAHPIGTMISYYISAADNSGRRETHPYVAPADIHSFWVRTLVTEERGDVDGDGQVNILDVFRVIKHIVGITLLLSKNGDSLKG